MLHERAGGRERESSARADGHQTVGDEHDLVVLAHAQHRGAVHQWAFLAITHPFIIAPPESRRQNGRSARSSSGRTPRARHPAPHKIYPKMNFSRKIITGKFRERTESCNPKSASPPGYNNCCSKCHCSRTTK